MEYLRNTVGIIYNLFFYGEFVSLLLVFLPVVVNGTYCNNSLIYDSISSLSSVKSIILLLLSV